jgi:hypothetical protein
METVFCRRNPTPTECLKGYHLDPEYPNVPASALEVKKSSVGENAGRGVFTKVDIPKNVYLSLETGAHNVLFMPSTCALIVALEEEANDKQLEALDVYMDNYGFQSRTFVSSVVFDKSGPSFALTLLNRYGLK